MRFGGSIDPGFPSALTIFSFVPWLTQGQNWPCKATISSLTYHKCLERALVAAAEMTSFTSLYFQDSLQKPKVTGRRHNLPPSSFYSCVLVCRQIPCPLRPCIPSDQYSDQLRISNLLEF